MTKQLTATLDAYHVYGTRGTMMAQILYRGQCVQHFDYAELAPILNAAKLRGFTHFRNGQTGRRQPIPDDLNRWIELRAQGARQAHAEMMRSQHGVNLQTLPD